MILSKPILMNPYGSVGSLLEEDFDSVFNIFNFDEDLYNSRYEKVNKQKVA